MFSDQAASYARRLSPGFILAAAVCLLLTRAPDSVAQSTALEFDGRRAFDLVVQQCDLGPRTPGSAGNRELRMLIKTMAGEAGFSATELCYQVIDPLQGNEVEICNVVVSIGDQAEGRLWLGAHYDTRPVCDRDPDPQLRDQPLVGANDGASGVAVLLHLLELMAASTPPTGVDLLFFDGEDSGRDGVGFCLGSSRLAETWQDFGSPLAGPRPRGLVVLDMVGDKDLRIPMELNSLAMAPEWCERIFERAAALGLDAFAAVPGRGIFDDHVAFLNLGIPAVDLIDFDFPQWHTSGDTPEVVSAASLKQVGTLALDLIYNP